MFDFELSGPNAVSASVNDEGYATLAFHNIAYVVGFGHSGYCAIVKVDGRVVQSEVTGVIEGEKFFNRMDLK